MCACNMHVIRTQGFIACSYACALPAEVKWGSCRGTNHCGYRELGLFTSQPRMLMCQRCFASFFPTKLVFWVSQLPPDTQLCSHMTKVEKIAKRGEMRCLFWCLMIKHQISLKLNKKLILVLCFCQKLDCRKAWVYLLKSQCTDIIYPSSSYTASILTLCLVKYWLI